MRRILSVALEIVAWINGSRDFADYEAAIDAAIAAAAL
jgi:hypothetical protein